MVKHPLLGCARVVLYCAAFDALGLFNGSKQNAVAHSKVPEFNILQSFNMTSQQRIPLTAQYTYIQNVARCAELQFT